MNWRLEVKELRHNIVQVKTTTVGFLTITHPVIRAAEAKLLDLGYVIEKEKPFCNSRGFYLAATRPSIIKPRILYFRYSSKVEST